jgi:hypothetical protein
MKYILIPTGYDNVPNSPIFNSEEEAREWLYVFNSYANSIGKNIDKNFEQVWDNEELALLDVPVVAKELGFKLNVIVTKEVDYDQTRDAAIQLVEYLIDNKVITEFEDENRWDFHIQDVIHDKINALLGIDTDKNFSVELKNFKNGK